MSDAGGNFNLDANFTVDLVGSFVEDVAKEMNTGFLKAWKKLVAKLPQSIQNEMNAKSGRINAIFEKAGAGYAKATADGYAKNQAAVIKAAVKMAEIAAAAGVKAEEEATKRARAHSRDVRATTAARIVEANSRIEVSNNALGESYNRLQSATRISLASERKTAAEREKIAARLETNQVRRYEEAGRRIRLTRRAPQIDTRNDLIQQQIDLGRQRRLDKLRQLDEQATARNMRRQNLVNELGARQADRIVGIRRTQVNRLNVLDQTQAAQAIQAARSQSAIEITEAQQSEKRRSLRLQRFNALTLQLTQAGLTKLRDARRLGAQQEIAQQQSSDKAKERVLRESLSRRESITRQFEARTLANSRTTQRLIDARTSTGVLGAARGASPLGMSLRSLAVVGGGALSIRAIFTSAQAFLTNFRRLGAITGATEAQLGQLRKTAIALGNDLALPGVSAGDATEALTKLVQAGFSVDQAIGAAKGTLLLARNNTIDFAEAAQFTGSAINSFGINASDALRAVDVAQKSLIAGGGQSFTELSQAIQQSGAVFSEFFAKTRGPVAAFEDMNIALDILAKNGLRGSDAGTSLKTFLIGLTGPSEAASKKIEELSKDLGIAGNLFFDSAGNARPFIESIKNLRESMAGLTQEQKLQELKLLFGTDAFRAAAIFIGQTNEELATYEKIIRESAGSSEALGKAVNQGMRAAFDNFSSVIETAGILLIEKIDRPLGNVIGKFAELTSSLLQGQGVWEVARAALAGIAVALGSILAVKGAVEVMGLMKGALLGLTSPAGAAVTVIAALGAAIGIGMQASDEFRESLGNLATFVKTDVLTPIREVFGSLFGSVKKVDPLAGLNAGQLSTLPDAIAQIAPKTNVVFDAVASTVNNVLLPALRTAVDFIKNTLIPGFGQMVRFIDDKVEPIIRRIGTLVADVAGLIAFEAQQRILPTLKVIADGFRDGFRGIDKEQVGGVVGVFQDIARVLGKVADAGGALFAGNFSEAGSKLAGLASSIGRALLEAVKGIDFVALAKTIFVGIGAAARTVGSALTTVFSEPVLKSLLGAAAVVAAVAADIAVNFAIGFVKGMQGRIDDITRVVVDVLTIAGKAALLALGVLITKGLPSLFKVALSGPLGLLAVGIAAAFGAVLFNKINNAFFKPFAAGAKATFLTFTGHVQQGQDGMKKFVLEQKQAEIRTATLKRQLGGGLFASFITGAGNAVTALGKLTDAGVGQAVAAGVATYVGAWQGGFAQIASLAGSTALVLQQLATGNVLGAGITAAFTVIGFALGNTARKAKEAKARVDEFTSNLRGGATAAEGFAAAVEAAASKSADLVAAMQGLNLTFSGLLPAISEGGVLAGFAGLDRANESLKTLLDTANEAAALDLGTGALAPQVVSLARAFDQVKDSLPPELRGSIEQTLAALNQDITPSGLRDAIASIDAARESLAGGAEEADAFSQIIKTALTSLSVTSKIEELALNVDSVTKAMQEARDAGTDLATTLPTVIPPTIIDQLTRMGLGMPELAAGLQLSGREFTDFISTVVHTGQSAGVLDEDINTVVRTLFKLRDAAAGTHAPLQEFASSVDKMRTRRLEKISEDWGSIETATRDATDALDEYFVAVRGGGSAQEAIDTALLAGHDAIENFHQFLVDHPGIKVSDLFILSQGQSKEALLFKKEMIQPFQDIVDDFMTTLPEEIKADPAKSRAAISAGLEEVFQLAIAGGFPAELLRGYFDIDALLATLEPLQTQAVERARLMREAIAAEFTKPLPIGTDFLTGSIPEVDLPSMVLQSIQIDDAVSQEIKDYIAEHSAEAVAAVKQVTIDQPATDTALSTALNTAQKKLPPIKVQATITDIDILDRALQSVSARIRAAVNSGQSGGGSGQVKWKAEGGIITSPTVAGVGEAGAEAIIPLTKPRRALQLLKMAGLDRLMMTGSMGSLRGAGKSVGEGAALGISQASGMVAGATAGLAGVIQSTFTRLLGIHSPSTVFEKYGRDIIDGLMKGLKEGAQAAGSAIQDFVNIFLGRAGTGGAVATGLDQLIAETKKQLVESLKELGGDAGEAVSAQSGAFSAITDFAKGAAGSTWKDKKGKVHKSKSKFATGFGTGTAAGAENRSALIEVISAARDAIVEDLAAGDTTGAAAVFKQLQDALKKAGKAKKGNQAVIDEILGQTGLGGKDPLADIMRQFTEATEELRRLTEAENARVEADAAARRAAATPPTVNNNFSITSPYDPFEVARRVAREAEEAYARAMS